MNSKRIGAKVGRAVRTIGSKVGLPILRLGAKVGSDIGHQILGRAVGRAVQAILPG